MLSVCSRFWPVMYHARGIDLLNPSYTNWVEIRLQSCIKFCKRPGLGVQLTNCIICSGANRGVGFQLVSRFLKLDYSVYGTFRPQTREDSSVAEVSSLLSSKLWIISRLTHCFVIDLQLKSTGAKALELDYTDENSINQAAKDFGDQHLDILVNCAGISLFLSFSELMSNPLNRAVLSLG
jgi:NAD(P)-dependent dehydrogenase (short-subunit alcohol dehydrogenase family)